MVEPAQGLLVVMARYPQPGQCKTRLIPRLGPHGAAVMHTELAGHTLEWARRVRGPVTRLEVHYAGGTAEEMGGIFGDDLDWVPQADGDLGDRLRSVVERSTGLGVRKVVIVGTDCPELTAHHAEAAFAALDHHHVVFQPAADGGYVLVGIHLCDPARDAAGGRAGHADDSAEFPCDPHRVCDRLFASIDWGTDRVLEQSIDRLAEVPGMRVRLMAPMNDVDRPEDLDVWQRVRDGRGGSPPRLAVIVPVYGREIELMQVLESAGAEPGVETIVVGAGDCRDALQACARQRVQFLCCGAANRGTQMNAGAAVATADRLLFLHADTRLPTGYADQVVRELARPEVVAGAFRLRIDSPRWAARIIERGVGWRSRLFQLPYGDQAIFCRKSDFQRAGGFRELPIMEDYEFIHRMRRRGRVSILQRSVLTSGRRWHRLGFLRTTLVNQAIVMAYRLGIAPDRLATWYRRGERNG